MLEDPLSPLSLPYFPFYLFFFFFSPARLLEVCPRKQSGTCATTAADSNDPNRLMEEDRKERRRERDVSQREREIERPNLF